MGTRKRLKETLSQPDKCDRVDWFHLPLNHLSILLRTPSAIVPNVECTNSGSMALIVSITSSVTYPITHPIVALLTMVLSKNQVSITDAEISIAVIKYTTNIRMLIFLNFVPTITANADVTMPAIVFTPMCCKKSIISCSFPHVSACNNHTNPPSGINNH